MSKFIEDIKKLYEEKKDMKTPPDYIKTIKKLLELEGVLLEDDINKKRLYNE
jgi:hypothetical protein